MRKGIRMRCLLGKNIPFRCVLSDISHSVHLRCLRSTHPDRSEEGSVAEHLPYARRVQMTRRTRAEQVAANDRALRSAVAGIAVETGWETVTFAGVARRAGLTVGAVYGRAENTAELAIDLWDRVVGPWFEESVEAVIDAGRSGDPNQMRAAYTHWDNSTEMSSLVYELIVASCFDDDMAEIVHTDAQKVLARHILPSTAAPKISHHEAAAAVLVVSFAFGRAIAVHGGVPQPPITAHQAMVNASMFGAEPFRGSLPQSPELQWVRRLPHDGGQPAVLQATLDVIGRVGYKRATIARIARTAGLPRGSVLSHYQDKQHLVAEAVRKGLVPPGEVWDQYEPVVADHGPLTSRALFLADFLKEANRHLWRVNLELARIARFHPMLEGFRPTPSVLENTHLGLMMTASLLPNLADLPYAGPFRAGTAT